MDDHNEPTPRIEVVASDPIEFVDLDYNPIVTVNRVQLTPNQLAEQLRVPTDFVRGYVRAQAVREMGPGATSAGFGLCAEELAALSFGAWLIYEWNLSMARAAEGIRRCQMAIENSQLNEDCLGVAWDDGKRCGLDFGVGKGEVDVPDRMKVIQHGIVNLSAYVAAIEVSMVGEPLKVPRIKGFATMGAVRLK